MGDEKNADERDDYYAWLEPVAPSPERVFAFAGIGKPQRFFAMLNRLGYEVVERAAFPDHHPFSEAELKVLARMAERLNARPICTEKDFVRLPADFRERTLTLPVEMRVSDPEGLKRRLTDCIAAAKKQRDNDGNG